MGPLVHLLFSFLSSLFHFFSSPSSLSVLRGPGLSSPFWHSGVFEYVLAVTDHTFGLSSKNRYSGTSNQEMVRRVFFSFTLSHSRFLSLPLILSLFHLTTTLVDWDGGIVKRISLGYRIRSRSPRRNKSKIPRWPPLGGYAHEVVMDWRGRLERQWPTVTAWARSRSCWRCFWNRSTCRRCAWIAPRSRRVAVACTPRSPIAPDYLSLPRRVRTAKGIVRAARIDTCWHPAPEEIIPINIRFHTNGVGSFSPRSLYIKFHYGWFTWQKSVSKNRNFSEFVNFEYA